MEWTSAVTAISLGILALCGIIIVGCLWRRHSPALVRIERVITWITFLAMLISIGLLTTYEIPDKSYKIEFSLIASVMAILVTVLVGWQVWQALVAREQLRDLETRIRNLEQNLAHAIERQIADYDIENSAMQSFIMGRSSMQLHNIIEVLNKNTELSIGTGLIAQSFENIGRAFQALKSHPNSSQYPQLYNALATTIDECEKCKSSLNNIHTSDIDRIIDALRNDNEFRENHNKQELIQRLENIKSSVEAIK